MEQRSHRDAAARRWRCADPGWGYEHERQSRIATAAAQTQRSRSAERLNLNAATSLGCDLRGERRSCRNAALLEQECQDRSMDDILAAMARNQPLPAETTASRSASAVVAAGPGSSGISETEPAAGFVKLAMRNMVRKGRQSLFHFGLTALGLTGFLLLIAWLGRPHLPQ